MICEVRDNGNEIVLKNITIADILAMVTIWICKDKELCFSKPQGKGYSEFCCGNEDSEKYSVPTFSDDTCDDFEEKDGLHKQTGGKKYIAKVEICWL